MSASAYLRAVWARVHAWARRRSRRTPALRLRVGCPMVSRMRRKDPRAYMHVSHRPGTVCVLPQAAALPLNYLVGLYLHEHGHPLAWRLWRSSDQHDADRAVRLVYGVRLSYAGPLLLERVRDSVARRILAG